MNNKMLLIWALLISLNTDAAEVKLPVCGEAVKGIKTALVIMCSLEPNPESCEAESIKVIEEEYQCKAGE